MSDAIVLHTHTPLATGLRDLFSQLEDRLELSGPLAVYLAGGMAVHLYTASRVTTDIDAEFAGRVMLPADLMIEVTLEDQSTQLVYLDTNYNSTFALIHEHHQDDAIAVDLGLRWLRVHVLSPVDLAVSKIARFADNDREDIAALVRLGLVTADAIEQRAISAAAYFVGGRAMLLHNIRDAVELARRAQHDRQRAADDDRAAKPSP